MPGKMARSPPSAIVRTTNHDDVVRAANRFCQNAVTAQKIHAKSGVIRGIPVEESCTSVATMGIGGAELHVSSSALAKT
jgi:hypothetical protein